MTMTNYIKLTVYEELSEEMISLWKKIVKKLCSVKLDSSVLTRRSKSCYYYKIILNATISETDLKFIVSAWDYYYKSDFEIESNTDISSLNDEIEIDEDILELIKTVSSKYLHNRWVDKKIHNGWRYGIYYNMDEKTHPALCNWDNLPIELKKHTDITPTQAYNFYIKHTKLFD